MMQQNKFFAQSIRFSVILNSQIYVDIALCKKCFSVVGILNPSRNSFGIIHHAYIDTFGQTNCFCCGNKILDVKINSTNANSSQLIWCVGKQINEFNLLKLCDFKLPFNSYWILTDEDFAKLQATIPQCKNNFNCISLD